MVGLDEWGWMEAKMWPGHADVDVDVEIGVFAVEKGEGWIVDGRGV